MSAHSVRRLVAFVGSTDVMLGAERSLTSRGVRVRRVPTLRSDPLPVSQLWNRIERFGPFDTLVVTSREGVRALFGSRTAAPSARRLRGVESWAIGPGAARALRSVGVRTALVPDRLDSSRLASLLARSPTRRIVYPRSDQAGSRLALALRRQGHNVLDLLAYRVGAPKRLPARTLTWLRRADRVVVTSPSALRNLRRLVDAPTFGQLRRSRNLVVLGERTARAARGHGIRDVRVAGTAATQRFTRFLLAGLDDAP